MANTKSFTLNDVKNAVSNNACAFRCRTTLQPAGGEGDKVFPPTYAGATYAKEQRRMPGQAEPVDCVLLDSVQSQANRMEEALQAALDQGRFAKQATSIPVIEVDFSAADKEDLVSAIGKVTSLQAPHRIADAILRDSLLDDKPFRQTQEGKNLDTVSLANATALYQLCPTALVFGMWDSTGPKGGLGAKFQRAMVSEIVGINAVAGIKTSSRIDPLQIVKNAGPLFRTPDGGWTLDQQSALKTDGKLVLYKQTKGKDVLWDPKKDNGTIPDQGRPSVANHGNVTPNVDYRKDQNGNAIRGEDGQPVPIGGVTIASAEQLVTLSLPALRRLQFPVEGATGDKQKAINEAGRTVLAALGLCAAALAAEKGLDLRSRCLLWPVGSMEWELLDRPGQQPTRLTLEAEAAIDLLSEAVAAADKLGLSWRKKPLVLKPAPQLVELVKKSQKIAAASGGDEGGE
jgi:CRISPR-associated protein Csb1